jgi:phosphatidate cytidylyltransferase
MNEFSKRIISSIILFPTTLFILIIGSTLFNLFILLCLLISIYEWYKLSKKKIYSYPGYIFLFFSFYTIYSLRNNFNNEYLYVLIVLLICIFSDIGGYVFGKFFKGPKLTKISPNKTYSGSFGSFFFSILISIFLINFDTIIFTIDIKFFEIIKLSILISFINQFGDIIVSYFKRLSEIKDTGKIIPGHGGLLDRIDGMIFAFPVSFILLKIELVKIY